VFGEFGLSVEAIDKREGTNNKYQFHRAELLINGQKEFEIEYNKIPFNQGKFAKTIIQYDMKRNNLGEFQKLYKLPEHKKISIHSSEKTGILKLPPGFHSIIVNIFDAHGNKSIIKGVIAGSFPMILEANEILKDEKVTILALSPRRGGLPIRSAVVYSFTSYGFPDQKLDILHSEKVKNDLHITLSSKDIKNRILQIVGINQIGGIVNPLHWASYKPKISVIDIQPDIEISNTERGLFFQVNLDQYVPAEVKIRLANDNTFSSYNLNQVSPNTFLTEMLSHQVVNNMKYIDVELSHDNLLRETRFKYEMHTVGPGLKNHVFSTDKNCSIKTKPNTFFQTNTSWIEKTEAFPPVENGFHLAPVYQLQPYDLALKSSFIVGIKYSRDLIEHSKIGIYFFDPKSKKWVYTPTENNKRKQILTAELDHMDAVTIIQDLDSPKIINTFPGNSGRYHIQDVNEIKITIDDPISGIESKESSFELKLNGKKLFCAYQPLKKEVSYNLNQPLSRGQHRIDFKAVDRVGNESSEVIYFVVY
jgi:arginine repressor